MSNMLLALTSSLTSSQCPDDPMRRRLAMEVSCKATKKKAALKKLKKTHSRGGGLPKTPPAVQDARNPGAPGTSSLMSLQACRTLVLDVSYRPIDVVNWQRAVCLDIFDKARLPIPQDNDNEDEDDDDDGDDGDDDDDDEEEEEEEGEDEGNEDDSGDGDDGDDDDEGGEEDDEEEEEEEEEDWEGTGAKGYTCCMHARNTASACTYEGGGQEAC